MPRLTPVPAPAGSAARPPGSRPRPLRVLAAVALAGALAAGGITSAAPATAAGFQRGPNPTVASLSAPTGPFAVAQFTARNVSGFGNVTICHPHGYVAGDVRDRGDRSGLLLVLEPAVLTGAAARVAGFVVVGTDTTSLLDLPSMRGDQLAAAMIAWLKRFVDEDTRYTRFLCPGPPVSTGVSAPRTTCPY